MSGNGVILERLSGKKLSILVSILIVLQVVFFFIGALFCMHNYYFNSPKVFQENTL